MIKLENLNRQHGTIAEEISIIENEIKKGSSSINIQEVALHINRLAGQLKIHLMEEDQFLYPNLTKSSDQDVRKMAKYYIDEMGDLANTFTEYKNNYNVASKISADIDAFIRDTKNTMEALKKRVAKEDKELYHLVKERNL